MEKIFSYILLVALIMVTCSQIQYAQDDLPKPEDFRMSAQATYKGNQCFQLTYPHEWSSGSIWFNKAISLKEPFSMEFEVFLGCDDEAGADGMVFVFHTQPIANGYRGEGMGFGGLVPSLGIEIDTWENEHLADPPEDHIALLQQGSVSHLYNLKGPITIPNIENCKHNKFEITWNPKLMRLRVSINGKTYLDYQGDIIEEVFFGYTKVYWGVTAATGRYYNRQEICFEKLEFAEPLENFEYDIMFSTRLLEGEVTPIQALDFKENTAELVEDAYPELFKIINLLKQNPEMHIDIAAHTNQDNQLELSKEQAKAIAEYIKKHGIDEDRIHHRGLGNQFPLKSKSSVKKKDHQRVEIYFYKPKA